MSKISRRAFLATSATAAAGLVVAFHLPASAESAAKEFAPNAYLHISPDDKVTIVVARSEMGQGVRTSLPMILAEELDCDFSKIAIEQAGASTLFGDQTTGGSASVRTTWDPMRKAGAQARSMLLTAAAKQWNVSRTTCKTEKGFVVHSASNRKASYGSLAMAAARLPVPKEPKIEVCGAIQADWNSSSSSRHEIEGRWFSHFWYRLQGCRNEVCVPGARAQVRRNG